MSKRKRALDLYDELNEERRPVARSRRRLREHSRRHGKTQRRHRRPVQRSPRRNPAGGALQQLYAQANGPTALFDAKVSEALKITDEQKTKLGEVRTEVFGSFRDSGIDWQSLSEEEADAEVDKMIASQNEKYAAVLTDEQRTEFEKLQGEKLEILTLAISLTPLAANSPTRRDAEPAARGRSPLLESRNPDGRIARVPYFFCATALRGARSSRMSRAAAKKRRQPPVADEGAAARRAWLNVTLAATTLASAWLFVSSPADGRQANTPLVWRGNCRLDDDDAVLPNRTVCRIPLRPPGNAALRPTRQVAVHAVLLMAAVAALAVVGVVPADAWKPAGEALPAAAILAMLAACVGLPYLMLAATPPLVQVWFARANPGRTPYRLYALSNLGSLAALVTYPLWVEPNLGVASQGVAWSAESSRCLLRLFTASGFLALRTEATPADFADVPTDAPGPDDSRPPWLQVFFWLALPATASVLLLAITTYLCQDVASIPACGSLR